MARVFVIGATGGVGSLVTAQLVGRGDVPIGLHRRPDQARQLEAAGAQPVEGDLTTMRVDALAGHLDDVDAIVFAAGAPDADPPMMDAVDGQGMVLATSAAEAARVRRFLHLSAFPDAWRDRRMSPEFEHYMKVKRQADVHLAATNLDWVIVRPGTLTNAPSRGRIRLGLAIPYGEVPRGDVAGVVVELIRLSNVNRMILELTSGETPIDKAVSAFQGDRSSS